MFEIIFYPHKCVCAYTFISKESVNLWHDTFNHMYFRDACTHLCDTMVRVCIHFYGMMPPIPPAATFSNALTKPLTSLFTETWSRDVRALNFETAFENVSAGGIGCT